LDDDALAFVPQPAAAVLLLFPITPEYEVRRAQEEVRIRATGQRVSPSLYFIKQTIPNACGTIGLLHSLGNNKDLLGLSDGPLKRILDRSAALSPEERAVILESDADLAAIHDETSRTGQSAVPNPEDDVDLHFVAFVAADGELYEMDGRKPFPINHGACSDLLKANCALTEFVCVPVYGGLVRFGSQDSARVVRDEFVGRSAGLVQFTVIALAPSSP
ncbi:Ubiquitin carboxyl-terminal hydrolase isozyme L3, partial [Cladochytrium tenue]